MAATKEYFYYLVICQVFEYLSKHLIYKMSKRKNILEVPREEGGQHKETLMGIKTTSRPKLKTQNN